MDHDKGTFGGEVSKAILITVQKISAEYLQRFLSINFSKIFVIGYIGKSIYKMKQTSSRYAINK